MLYFASPHKPHTKANLSCRQVVSEGQKARSNICDRNTEKQIEIDVTRFTKPSFAGGCNS